MPTYEEGFATVSTLVLPEIVKKLKELEARLVILHEKLDKLEEKRAMKRKAADAQEKTGD